MHGRYARPTIWHAKLEVSHPSVFLTLTAVLPHQCINGNGMPELSEDPITQANERPFLTHPLLMNLGLLNCHQPAFDKIFKGTCQPPPETPTGAQLLLPHLAWLVEVDTLLLKLDTATYK